MTTISNSPVHFWTRGGQRVVALIVVAILLGCAGSSKGTPSVENLTNQSVQELEASSPAIATKSSFLQYKSGLQALENHDWLEAQYYLDLALSELISELDDSTTAADSAELHSMTFNIMVALEKVYPHLSEQSVVDSGYSLLEEAAPIDEMESVPDEPLDSSELSQLERQLKALDLSKFSLPVVLNERVLREIRFFTKGATEFMRGSLSRMTMFDSVVRAKLRERNMPEDLIFLSLVESGFKVKAYSSAKASGLWQFIPATGRRYGLQVDFWVDERRNPVMATDAALDYLQDLHNEFGDWLLAMAAYNCGEGRVRRLLREADSLDYWSLKLPRETMHYVPRILAAAIIGHAPEQYGFVQEPQTAIPFDTVTVNECVPLQAVADAAGASLSTIRDLNIELNRWTTPPNQRSYVLRIPSGTRDRFIETYSQLDKTKFSRWSQHRVRSGENLGVIARAYGLSVSELRDVNGLKKNNRIRAGQTLLIPLPYGAAAPSSADRGNSYSSSKSKSKSGAKSNTYVVRKGDNLSSIARRFGVSSADLQEWNGMSDTRLMVGKAIQIAPPKVVESSDAQDAPKTTVKAGSATYTVKSGDNYYNISQNLGVSMNDLMELNEAKGTHLSAGQILRLPDGFRARSVERKVDKSEIVVASRSEERNESPKSDVHVIREGENLSAIARKYDVSLSELMRWNSLDGKSKIKIGQKIKVKPESVSRGSFHTVRKGDTLWDIARRYGVSIQQIMDWNALPDGKVKPGVRIKVGI